MDEQKKNSATQPDAGKAAIERPVPSQAEGDLETIEQDLQEKEKAASSGKK
jgi:hypothetical protein